MEFEVKNCSVLDAGADIIVNAANSSLSAGGGVCGAIFSRAGYDVLQEACNGLAPIDTGNAVLTKGYNSGAEYIVHAVGPNMWDNKLDWKMKLRQVYWNSLKVADNIKGNIIAFPCISTGIFGCPLRESSENAIAIVNSFNAKYLKKAIFCCFTEEEYEVYLDIISNII